MRVGILHNAYRYRGGEEAVADAEARLLAHAGVSVSRMTFENTAGFATLTSSVRSITHAATGWNKHAGDKITEWARSERLDVVHAHNIFPLITGAGLDALRRIRVPIVLTLHNFKPLCAAGTLTRDGQSCTDCVGSSPSGALRHRCYRGSLTQTLSWTAARARADATGLWSHGVSAFVAPSESVRDVYAEAGFPAERIIVRPHFTDLPRAPVDARNGVVLVGRVDEAKGVLPLIERWGPDLPRLTVVGDGPMLAQARQIAGRNVDICGPRDRKGVARTISGASVLVAPSQLPETFGLTLIEAAACGTPAVAFANGGSRSIIADGQTGVVVDPGNWRRLIDAAVGLATDRARSSVMGASAFDRFQRHFSPSAGLRSLMAVYESALAPRTSISA